jgi:hypothetical protein
MNDSHRQIIGRWLSYTWKMMFSRELIIGWQVMVDNWMMVFSWLANSCKQMVGIYLLMGGWCMEDKKI